MLQILQFILQNLTFFALHLKNLAGFPKPLSAKRESELLKQMKTDKTGKARNELIEHNLRLVSHVIKKYYSNCDEQEDLISIGTIGLIKAIDSFNADKNVRLATYAARCIENEVLMYYRSRKKDGNNISVNEPIDTDSEGNTLTLIDIISTDDTICDDIDLKNKTAQLYKLIEGLDDARDKEIIIKRYGLYNQREMTQSEIADLMGISRSYVSRIEKRVIGELREKFSIDS